MKINKKTLHVVGDSISLHYGPYLEKYIENSLTYSRKEGKLGNLDFPEGANAGDSSMVLNYLNKCKLENLHWDILLINCGLHDIKIYEELHQINISQYKYNLEQIFYLTNFLSNKTIWINTTQVIDNLHNSLKSEFKRFNKDVEKYNEVAKKIAISNHIPIIDLNGFCKSLGGQEIYQDHVHFIHEIQKLQAAYIAGHIKSLCF